MPRRTQRKRRFFKKKRAKTLRRRRAALKGGACRAALKGGAWQADRIPNDAIVITGKDDDDFVPQLSTMADIRSAQEN